MAQARNPGVEPSSGVQLPSTLQDAATSAGDGDYLLLPTTGTIRSGATITVQAALSGAATLVPEVSHDGVVWNTVRGRREDTGLTVTSITASGGYVFDATGWTYFQTRLSVAAGITTVTALFSPDGESTGAGSGGGGLVDQGLPAVIANAWPILVTDGVSILGVPGFAFEVNEASLDVLLSTRASEATLAALGAFLLGVLDVPLSSRASEATLLTRASEATLLTRATEATLLTRASEATLLTRASEVTAASILAQLDVALSTRASQATVAAILAQLDVALSTRASEATLLSRASEATLLTRASEVTVASILAQLDVALSTRASQVTAAAILAQLDVALSTRASEATLALIKAKTDNLDVLLSTRASEATLATRASEATLALIKAKTDNLDVLLSTRASEATLATRAAAATQTDGTQKSIVRGGAKGATVAADVTSTAQSADRQGLDVQVRTSAGVAVDSFGGGTEYTEDVAAPADPTGKAASLRRRDTLVAETTTDGDWVTQNATNKGEAYVKHVDPVSTKTPLTAAAPTFTTVGAASASAVAANANRKGLVLTNTSNRQISLGIGAAAVLDSGITLQPDGVWEMDEYTFSTDEIFAISTAAGKNLAIQEFST